jgi:hypothetical protein
MTFQEIIAALPRLSVQEQLLVLEALSRSLRADMSAPTRSPGSAERLAGIMKVDGPAPTDQQIRESLVDRLYGAFKTDGQPLTDADIDRIRYEALMEQHP